MKQLNKQAKAKYKKTIKNDKIINPIYVRILSCYFPLKTIKLQIKKMNNYNSTTQ